jgi:y4mF family transcriptional regulator
MNAKEIGRIVLAHRKHSGLTQKQLADISGVGKTVVFDVEKGKETVQLNSLLNIFAVLNIQLVLKSPFIKSAELKYEKS